MNEKDKSTPKHKRQQHAKNQLQKTAMKHNPFDCINEMNDGTTRKTSAMKHNHTETRERQKSTNG